MTPLGTRGPPPRQLRRWSLLLCGIASAAAAQVDHYRTLSVPRTASQQDIKGAYRRLALRYHPDKPGGCPERFRRINEANEVLGDPNKRREYDLQRSNPFAGRPGAPGGSGAQQWAGGAGVHGFESFFHAAREEQARRRQQQQEQQQQPVPPAVRTFACTLEELDAGCRKTVVLEDNLLSRLRDAVSEGPSGRAAQVVRQTAQQVAASVAVLVLRGQGQLLFGWGRWWFRFPLLLAALVAFVSEKLPVSPSGTYDIDVRPGWRAGTKVKFSRRPRAVTFQLREAPHERLRRSRDDLVFTARVSSAAAARGVQLRVPRLNGDDWVVELEPGEAHDGLTRRFSGGGMPIKGGPGRGDLMLEVRVVG